MVGVYKLLNVKTGKFYIGSSVNIEKRWSTHIAELNANCHNNKYLQNAWNKYGQESFEFIVVEEVDDILKLREREDYYLQSTNCTNHRVGYNLLNTSNIGLGVRASDEVRHKISDACKGEKNGHYRHKHSIDKRKQIRDARWGKDYVKKPRKKYQRKSEEELRESNKRRSEKKLGTHLSDATKEKLRQIHLGSHHSYETRQKMSLQRQGESNGNSKFTREQVLEIYHKMNSGVNYKDVCKEYGIGQCQAYKIKRKEHWVFNDTTDEIL